MIRQYIFRTYIPAASIKPYPNVITVAKARIEAGTPRVKKCFTCRYRTPVSGTSIIIAAVDRVSHAFLRIEDGMENRNRRVNILMFGKPDVGRPIAQLHISAEPMTRRLGCGSDMP